MVSVDPPLHSRVMFGKQGSVEPTSPHAPGADPQKQAENHLLAAFSLDFDPQDDVLSYLEEPFITTWFPTEGELLRYEAKVIASAGKRLLSHGRQAAFRRFEAILGPLSVGERRDYLALGYAYSRELAASGTEDDRAVMVARYEDLIARAKNALDLRVELAAARALSTVQGLTAVDADKSQRELILLLGQRNPSHGHRPAALDDAKDAEVSRPRIRAIPG